jgi:hypothetical protein
MGQPRRHLLDEERCSAHIVISPIAGRGLRHVVVVRAAGGDVSFGTAMPNDDHALCGLAIMGFYGEFKPFNPKTIGCKRCKAVWQRTMEKST